MKRLSVMVLILSIEYRNASVFQTGVAIVVAKLSTENRRQNFPQLFLGPILGDGRDLR
jgi:hypothetical protein